MIGARGLHGLKGAERLSEGSLEVFGPPSKCSGLGYAVRTESSPDTGTSKLRLP